MIRKYLNLTCQTFTFITNNNIMAHHNDRSCRWEAATIYVIDFYIFFTKRISTLAPCTRTSGLTGHRTPLSIAIRY